MVNETKDNVKEIIPDPEGDLAEDERTAPHKSAEVEQEPIFRSHEEAQNYIQSFATALVERNNYSDGEGYLCRCGQAFPDGKALRNHLYSETSGEPKGTHGSLGWVNLLNGNVIKFPKKFTERFFSIYLRDTKQDQKPPKGKKKNTLEESPPSPLSASGKTGTKAVVKKNGQFYVPITINLKSIYFTYLEALIAEGDDISMEDFITYALDDYFEITGWELILRRRIMDDTESSSQFFERAEDRESDNWAAAPA